MIKRLATLVTLGLFSLLIFAGCFSGIEKDFITVVSREDGSGTRGAFIELLDIEKKTADGRRTDNTTKEAIVVNKTDVMLTQISGNKNAIGYISLGSLNDSVKAINVDRNIPTIENVKNGTYKISRPFEIVTKNNTSDSSASLLEADFIKFILSTDGQSIVTDNKYILVNDKSESFKSDNIEGKLVIAGSSSVSPIMEKLAEAYKIINTKATIEIQQSDSTSGIKSVTDGIVDIGMSSRELKDSEKETLNSTTIAMDGIAIIVNINNPITNMSSNLIKEIYTGNIENWSNVR